MGKLKWNFVMEEKMSKQYWEIKGIDGQKTIFKTQIPAGQITEEKLKLLLQLLSAKYGLAPEEICDSLEGCSWEEIDPWWYLWFGDNVYSCSGYFNYTQINDTDLVKGKVIVLSWKKAN